MNNSFNINIFCLSTTQFDYKPLADTTNPCAPVVQIISSYGCDVLSVSELWGYIAAYEQYFGAFFIVAGIILCYMGHWLMGPTMCIVGFLTSIAATCVIFYAVYFTATTDPKEFWYWLGGGVILGVIVGILLMKFQKVGAAMAAGWGGAVGGMILNEAVLYRFGYSWMFWVSTTVCAAVAGFLATKAYDKVLIVATSVLGSYALIRGVSMYAGHYYNEFTMAKMMQAGLLADIDPFYWCYVGAFVIFSILGIFIQNKHHQKKLAKE
jgi:hypothetical protein